MNNKQISLIPKENQDIPNTLRISRYPYNMKNNKMSLLQNKSKISLMLEEYQDISYT